MNGNATLHFQKENRFHDYTGRGLEPWISGILNEWLGTKDDTVQQQGLVVIVVLNIND